MKKLLILLIIVLASIHTQAQHEKYYKLKIFASTPEHFETLAKKGVTLENLERKPGEFIVGEFSETEIELIRSTGIPFEILISDMASFYVSRNSTFNIKELNQEMKRSRKSIGGYITPENFTLGSMGGFHTYTELLAELDKMRTLYPNLISVKQPIGANVTIENRPVYWVRISSNPNNDQSKRRVLYTALTHAREPASMQQMLYQMWYLLENYTTNPEIEYIINNLELYFIPCVNPDGYIYNQTTNPAGGGMWRKNMRLNFDGTRGVDLNRNFGYFWGFDNSGSSPIGSSLTYRGTAPFSEPETQLVKLFAESKNFALALNNHTYSDLLIYPWAYANLTTPDAPVFETYAALMTKENGYTYGTCYQTLNYTANGGSDDWFYGEQLTKNKVLAFTPEAGSPADGFWPQANRIEAICAGHTQMNLYLSRFALKYAKTTETAPSLLGSFQSQIPFETICLGIDTPATFSISLTPLTNNVLSVDGPKVFNQMKLLQSKKDTFRLQLKGGIEAGETIRFILSTSNGSFSFTDTITKHFGVSHEIFSDAANNLSRWNSSGWGVTSSYYTSPSSSITDSPSGPYAANSNTFITTKNTINLSNATSASVEFMARWDIETNWDYVQFMVSTNNGISWTPLTGKYTTLGGANQDFGKPLYQGLKNSWVKESIDLSSYLGQSVLFRFRLISDGTVQKDGFYFDDFKIYTTIQAPTYNIDLPNSLWFRQGESLVLNVLLFISSSNTDQLSLSWSGNSNIHVEPTGWNVTFSAISDHWYGAETITFKLHGPLGYVEQVVTIECRKTNAIPSITGQSILYTNKNVPLNINLNDLTVSDEDNTFPDDFSLFAFEGENYTLDGLTISPVNNFIGNLSVPIKVFDGYDYSEIFPLEVEVRDFVGVHPIPNKPPYIRYYNASQEIIIIPNSITNISKVSIIDMFGRNVLTRKVVSETNEIRINTESKLPSGLYLVLLIGEKTFSDKIVIQ